MSITQDGQCRTLTSKPDRFNKHKFLLLSLVRAVAPTEAIIVDDDRIVEVVFDVAEQAFEFGPEFNSVGTANFPVDHIAPSVLASEIGEGGIVFEQNVFLAVRIIATL